MRPTAPLLILSHVEMTFNLLLMSIVSAFHSRVGCLYERVADCICGGATFHGPVRFDATTQSVLRLPQRVHR